MTIGLGFNTWGLRSIRTDSFNEPKDGSGNQTPFDRSLLVTVLRVHNLVLNVLGYIPGISFYSGHVRMATGLAMCAVAQLHLKNNNDIYMEEYYVETLQTGIAQIARGALEAYFQYGPYFNAFLDVSSTLVNVFKEYTLRKGSDDFLINTEYAEENPQYPLPLRFLYVV